MIVKTLRDAEFALNNLQRQLDGFVARSQEGGVTLSEVKALVRSSQNNHAMRQNTVINMSQFDATDIDSTPSEGQILHRLIHIFYSDVRFAKALRLADGWFHTSNGLQEWKINTGFDNPVGGADPNLQMRWLDSVTPANNKGFYLDPSGLLVWEGSVIPYPDNAHDLGNSSLRFKKLWVVDIDFSGTITGALPTSEANTELNANASGSLSLTTSFVDVAGATVSLNKDGKWLVLCNVIGSKEINDDEIQGQLVFDGVAQSGIIRMGASSADFLRSTGSRSWVVTVVSQPKVAKLQCKKNAGTGFSTVDATNSNIVAVYLTV